MSPQPTATDRRTHRHWVRLALETWGPSTADRLAAILAARCSPESVRGAIVALRRERQIRPAGYATTRHGCKATRWELVPRD
mgnify:CR=1 FL=1